jgi:hypothetical protein
MLDFRSPEMNLVGSVKYFSHPSSSVRPSSTTSAIHILRAPLEAPHAPHPTAAASCRFYGTFLLCLLFDSYLQYGLSTRSSRLYFCTICCALPDNFTKEVLARASNNEGGCAGTPSTHTLTSAASLMVSSPDGENRHSGYICAEGGDAGLDWP